MDTQNIKNAYNSTRATRFKNRQMAFPRHENRRSAHKEVLDITDPGEMQIRTTGCRRPPQGGCVRAPGTRCWPGWGLGPGALRKEPKPGSGRYHSPQASLGWAAVPGSRPSGPGRATDVHTGLTAPHTAPLRRDHSDNCSQAGGFDQGSKTAFPCMKIELKFTSFHTSGHTLHTYCPKSRPKVHPPREGQPTPQPDTCTVPSTGHGASPGHWRTRGSQQQGHVPRVSGLCRQVTLR